MTTFTDRLARSRAMYEAGEEIGRAAIARGVAVPAQQLRAAYPPHESASLMLGVFHVVRSCVEMGNPAKSPEHRAKLRVAGLHAERVRQARRADARLQGVA